MRLVIMLRFRMTRARRNRSRHRSCKNARLFAHSRERSVLYQARYPLLAHVNSSGGLSALSSLLNHGDRGPDKPQALCLPFHTLLSQPPDKDTLSSLSSRMAKRANIRMMTNRSLPVIQSSAAKYDFPSRASAFRTQHCWLYTRLPTEAAQAIGCVKGYMSSINHM